MYRLAAKCTEKNRIEDNANTSDVNKVSTLCLKKSM